MYIFQGDSITEVFYNGIEVLLHEGQKWQTIKGKVRELMPALINIRHAGNKLLVVPERHSNIAASIAEFLWTMAGREDIAFMERYLPRCKNFSEDGVTWKGAYGPRIFSYEGINQLQKLLERMKRNRYTREGIIELYNPMLDSATEANSPGTPCTNVLQFSITKQNKLDLYVTMRSNDIVWGFTGPNYFLLSSMQEIIAYWLNAEVGEYHQFVCSLDLFERHFRQVEEMLENRGSDIYKIYDKNDLKPDFTYEEMNDILSKFFEIEKDFDDIERFNVNCNKLENLGSKYIMNLAYVLNYII